MLATALRTFRAAAANLTNRFKDDGQGSVTIGGQRQSNAVFNLVQYRNIWVKWL
jgi:hypothetical protein